MSAQPCPPADSHPGATPHPATPAHPVLHIQQQLPTPHPCSNPSSHTCYNNWWGVLQLPQHQLDPGAPCVEYHLHAHDSRNSTPPHPFPKAATRWRRAAGTACLNRTQKVLRPAGWQLLLVVHSCSCPWRLPSLIQSLGMHAGPPLWEAQAGWWWQQALCCCCC
jgi:hypothetical protein